MVIFLSICSYCLLRINYGIWFSIALRCTKMRLIQLCMGSNANCWMVVKNIQRAWLIFSPDMDNVLGKYMANEQRDDMQEWEGGGEVEKLVFDYLKLWCRLMLVQLVLYNAADRSNYSTQRMNWFCRIKYFCYSFFEFQSNFNYFPSFSIDV